jgi:hypothetical protein
MPLPGTLVKPRLLKNSGVQALGAQPLDASAYSFFSLADQTIANRSPPRPVLPGSTTPNTAAAATAASIAFPPSSKIRNPAAVARGWLVATMPLRASTSERPWSRYPSGRVAGTAVMFSPGVGTPGVGFPNALGDCARPGVELATNASKRRELMTSHRSCIGRLLHSWL